MGIDIVPFLVDCTKPVRISVGCQSDGCLCIDDSCPECSQVFFHWLRKNAAEERIWIIANRHAIDAMFSQDLSQKVPRGSMHGIGYDVRPRVPDDSEIDQRLDMIEILLPRDDLFSSPVTRAGSRRCLIQPGLNLFDNGRRGRPSERCLEFDPAELRGIVAGCNHHATGQSSAFYLERNIGGREGLFKKLGLESIVCEYLCDSAGKPGRHKAAVIPDEYTARSRFLRIHVVGYRLSHHLYVGKRKVATDDASPSVGAELDFRQMRPRSMRSPARSNVASCCSFVGKQAVVGNHRVVAEYNAPRNHRIAADPAILAEDAAHQPCVVSN